MRQLKITQQITNRETLSSSKYLQEIGKIDMITQGEEIELAKRIKEGDKIALDKLTKANLRFVVSVAKQYQNQGLSLGDLINEGNLGLIKAASRFDETKGFKFISYAVWWIRQSILQAIAEQYRIVRLPLNQIGAQNRINRAYSKLEQKFEREPSFEELSKMFLVEDVKISIEDIASLMISNNRHVSLDAEIVNGEQATLLDLISCEEVSSRADHIVVTESLSSDICRAINTLKPREGDVIRKFFGIGTARMTLEEIGEEFELTRERVRQIKEKALRSLKHSSKIKKFQQLISSN